MKAVESTVDGETGVLRERIDLRERIVDAASKVFVQEGYDSLSMRRVAQEAGCSQMAMYRHFANKEALIQFLCSQLYTRFASKMTREIAAVEEPWEKLRRFIAALIRFAVAYPDHYSLIFLVRHANAEVIAERERLGKAFLGDVREIVRLALPLSAPSKVVDDTLRRMLSFLHGTTALLIAHPKAYGLTKQRAIEDAEAVFLDLLQAG
jgi:AcrR family transcriptional regulator